MAEKRKYEIDRNFAADVKRRYSPIPKDETEKIFDNIQNFFYMPKSLEELFSLSWIMRLE